MQQVTIPAHIQAQLINSIGRIEAPEASFIIGCCSTAYQYHSPFSANTKEQPGTPSLLLLTIIDADLRTCTEAQSRIENACSSIMELTSWVIPLQAFNQQLEEGGWLAVKTLSQATPLLREPDAGFVQAATARPIAAQPGWLQRATEFMAAAQRCILRKQWALAAFMLHQSAEQALTSIIYHSTGHRPATHNIVLLYQYSIYFAPLLSPLFSTGSRIGESPLGLLQKAYTGSRYTENFYIPVATLQLLTEKITLITGIAENLPEEAQL